MVSIQPVQGGSVQSAHLHMSARHVTRLGPDATLMSCLWPSRHASVLHRPHHRSAPAMHPVLQSSLQTRTLHSIHAPYSPAAANCTAGHTVVHSCLCCTSHVPLSCLPPLRLTPRLDRAFVPGAFTPALVHVRHVVHACIPVLHAHTLAHTHAFSLCLGRAVIRAPLPHALSCCPTLTVLCHPSEIWIFRHGLKCVIHATKWRLVFRRLHSRMLNPFVSLTDRPPDSSSRPTCPRPAPTYGILLSRLGMPSALHMSHVSPASRPRPLHLIRPGWPTHIHAALPRHVHRSLPGGSGLALQM